MPTHRTDRTRHTTERALTPDEAIDTLSYGLQWLVRQRLEDEARQTPDARKTGSPCEGEPASMTPTQQRASIVMSTTDHDKENDHGRQL